MDVTGSDPRHFKTPNLLCFHVDICDVVGGLTERVVGSWFSRVHRRLVVVDDLLPGDVLCSRQ